jgi:hypothetical protein
MPGQANWRLKWTIKPVNNQSFNSTFDATNEQKKLHYIEQDHLVKLAGAWPVDGCSQICGAAFQPV